MKWHHEPDLCENTTSSEFTDLNLKVSSTLAYLSGAPRASTKAIATTTGPRQHMLGTILGFQLNGWEVHRYIVGDKVPESWLAEMAVKRNSLSKLISFKFLVADAMRIALSTYHVRKALLAIPKPDLVYERYGLFQCFGDRFKRRGARWILETNAPLFLETTNDVKSVALPGLVRWYEKRAYQDCDILVVVSDDLKRIIVERLGVPSAKILVVPNAADTELFDPEKVQPIRLFDEETLVFGFQGSMYKWAGLDHLIKAIAKIRKTGARVGAVLLGDGLERSNLQALVSELGISDWVRFPGRVMREEVPAYIAGFDIGYSGQVQLSAGSMYLSPLKLYDYMSMGKPVLATRFADAIALVGANERGYLCAPADADDLVAVASRVYVERSMLIEKGHAARAEILARHTWEARVRGLLAASGTMFSIENAQPTLGSR